ncbi:MAG TPA: hypothetical protein PK280_07830 [Planctomycetota bacterium]|nr:hypothetical protein [Planctomycetota bacterium]
MRRTLALALPAALLLATATAAEPPAATPAAAPTAAPADGLREIPADKLEALRDRPLHATATLKDGSRLQGVIESFEPAKDGLPGAFVFAVDGGKTRVVHEVEVVRLEIGEAVKDVQPVRREAPPELQEAIKNGRVEQFVERQRAILHKATTLPQARWSLALLLGAYRNQGLEKKALRDRLQADVDGVENEPIRAELHRMLQDERFLWAKPLRPGGGARGLGPGRENGGN